MTACLTLDGTVRIFQRCNMFSLHANWESPNQNIGTRRQPDRDDAGARDKTQIAANSCFAGQQEARHFGEAQRA